MSAPRIDHLRRDIHVHGGTSADDRPGPTQNRGTDAERRAIAEEVRRWAPLVRRHAIRTARKCSQQVSVADLCDAGFDGLLEAMATARWVSPQVESDRYLETAVLLSMRAYLLAQVAPR